MKPTCSIEGCSKPRQSRGWCSMHWSRWARHGDPMAAVRERVDAGHVVCTVPGCGRPHHSKGWCDKHADRVRKYGSPYKLQRIRGNDAERLLSYVEIDLETGCWRYTGTHDAGGYGRLYSKSAGRHGAAHRLAYQLWVGPLVEGLEIDHVWTRGCRFRDCVLPDHLEQVSPSVNSLRREQAQRAVNEALSGPQP